MLLSDELVGEIFQCHIDAGDPTTFVVGRLVWKDDKWFLMQDISSVGRWNGLALYMQADVVSIGQNTDYISRIKTLLKCRNEAESIIPSICGDPLIDMLSYAKKERKVICLELCASGDRDVIGTIDLLTEHILGVIQIDDFGKSDGKSYVSLNEITRCFMDDEESKCIEMLRKS